MTTSSDPGLAPGTVITGKWKRGSYVIQRLLGRGANGTVYLVRDAGQGRQYALKLGKDAIDLQSEINVLTTLQTQGKQAAFRTNGVPSYLFEVDDFRLKDKDVPFYVMKYVKGEPLHLFIARNGMRWYGVAGLAVLNRLAELHESDWVFGDLKPQNIMVASLGETELIDYGGVTKRGSSVKQFTEWYDRGYWNAGGRSADPQYDLFSFALLTIHILEGDALKAAAAKLPQLRSISELTGIIARSRALRPYAGWLVSALRGEHKNTRRAALAWSHLAESGGGKDTGRKHKSRWLGYAFTASLVMLAGAIWMALR
ncbi:serine/threonine protein kinase [Paenibacillus sp. P96]|uniref:Serine/threonine protein kinase n=1 Tax=Paenibacillus zeirhizosphaerae TaxID=2987519 RepID=A0ABT9FWX3_9BACL|nr:serine/threonine protein kinase [Paenibacillus sp. P96]MDP4099195.1 serine/threonine protein kinase [Paenibacillus sp. P96]